MKLKGKVAIVTGGGSGFGAGMVRKFSAEGAVLVINDLHQEAVDATVAVVKKGGGQAIGIAGDVSRGDVFERIVADGVSAFGRVDVLVNNAGYTHRNQSLLTVSEEDFDRVVAVNLKSIFFAARHVIPVMTKQGGGSIINIGSVGALRPRPGLGWYCAAKGAVDTISRVMAVEFAPVNVRVNCICPAAADTGMMDASLGEDTPERRARVIGTIPLGRLATPEDIASMAAFLASDEAAFITGGIYPVDGGRSV